MQRRVLELDYVDKDGQPTGRVVEPVAVLGIHPNWYLWAWCRLRDAPRAFRLDRIRGAVMHDEIAPDRSMDVGQMAIPDLIGRGILGSEGRREFRETPTHRCRRRGSTSSA